MLRSSQPALIAVYYLRVSFLPIGLANLFLFRWGADVPKRSPQERRDPLQRIPLAALGRHRRPNDTLLFRIPLGARTSRELHSAAPRNWWVRQRAALTLTRWRRVSGNRLLLTLNQNYVFSFYWRYLRKHWYLLFTYMNEST